MTMVQLKSRFHVLSFVLLAASVVGTPYAFGIFSMIFRQNLGYSQLDLSIVSSCGSTGLYTGVVCGLGVERFGPVRVLQCGALFIFLGNFYVWLAVQKLVWHSVAPVACAYVIAQLGTACATNVALIVAIRIFPPEVTGQAAGLSKGYFGASSAVLATVAACFFHSPPSTNFVLFVSLALPLVLLSASLNTNFLPDHMVSFSYEQGGGWSPSLSPYVHHLLLLLACILAIGGAQHVTALTGPVSVTVGCILCAAVLSVLLIPSWNKGPRSIAVLSGDVSSLYGTQYQELDSSVGSLASVHSPFADSLVSAPPSYGGLKTIEFVDMSSKAKSSGLEYLESAFSYSGADDEDDDVVIEFDLGPTSEEEEDRMGGEVRSNVFVSFYGRHLCLTESLQCWRLYAIMAVFCIVAGSGLLVINNIQAVAGAVHKQPSAFFVTVISLANAAGRVLIGLVADARAHHSLSRFQLLAIIALLMAGTQFTLSIGSSTFLFPCLLLTGVMFGATFSNIAALSSDVFGSRHVGSNYGFIDMAPAVGSYVFSAGLVALFYPHGASGDGSGSDADMCRGVKCFQTAFHVTTAACAFAAALSFFLHLTTLVPMIKLR